MTAFRKLLRTRGDHRGAPWSVARQFGAVEYGAISWPRTVVPRLAIVARSRSLLVKPVTGDA